MYLVRKAMLPLCNNKKEPLFCLLLEKSRHQCAWKGLECLEGTFLLTGIQLGAGVSTLAFSFALFSFFVPDFPFSSLKVKTRQDMILFIWSSLKYLTLIQTTGWRGMEIPPLWRWTPLPIIGMELIIGLLKSLLLKLFLTMKSKGNIYLKNRVKFPSAVDVARLNENPRRSAGVPCHLQTQRLLLFSNNRKQENERKSPSRPYFRCPFLSGQSGILSKDLTSTKRQIWPTITHKSKDLTRKLHNHLKKKCAPTPPEGTCVHEVCHPHTRTHKNKELYWE